MPGAELFAPLPPGTPRVFALAPGADFAQSLLAGLHARTQAPQTLARTQIYVNTERARRRLTTLAEGASVSLLPGIHPITAIADLVPDLPPADPALRRNLALAQLVRAALKADPTLAARTSAYPLAESLTELSGEIQVEGIDPAAFQTLDPGELAAHWTRSLEFLNLIGTVLADPQAPQLDAEARLRRAVETLAETWAHTPPQHPVIIAGSTGSRGATALLMQAVAQLPQGAVVLPGLDSDLPEAVWEALWETGLTAPVDHPQWGLARICRRLGVDPRAVPQWVETAPTPRNRLVSLALRPAPITDQWRAEGPALAPQIPAATDALTLLEADDPKTEALALALLLRGAVEKGQTAALITPDRQLTRRVTAALDRWGLAADDSAGRPLDLTPPGSFLRLTAELLNGAPGPAPLLALLKHPLTASTQGPTRGLHLGQTARLEALLRRHGTPAVTAEWLDAQPAEDLDPTWVTWLSDVLPDPPHDLPLPELLTHHMTLAERLAAGPGQDGSGALWEAQAGEVAAAALAELHTHAAAGGTVPLAEYPRLFRAILAARDVPDAPYAPYTTITIWGTLEARTQSADLMLLAGLNEGSWPRLPTPDLWLSRGMRDALGMPLPEQRIGLSAHDFQQAICGPQVVLSRALRAGEAPTVPARWLLRLTNLLAGLPPEGPAALKAMRQRGRHWLDLAKTLDRPEADQPRAPRPGPIVPPAAFPKALPVTAIDRLIRDPYAVYASTILKLRRLDPLTPAADAMLRGTLAHRVMERFIAATPGPLPADARTRLETAIRETLTQAVPWPAMRTLWERRLMALTDFILEGEVTRRALADPQLTEARGQIRVTGTAEPFTLTARLDRLDRRGPLAAIYDYKGGLPSAAEAKAFHKQLPLEAGIALRGGFEGAPITEVAALQLIGLSKGGAVLDLDTGRDALDTDWADLTTLISAYQSGTHPMVARLRPKFAHETGDHDHLARRGEWDDSDTAQPVVLT